MYCVASVEDFQQFFLLVIFSACLGLYLLVGYSIDEVDMLKKSVPKNILERAGFVSGNDYIMHDIGSRLQLALERIMPLVCFPVV